MLFCEDREADGELWEEGKSLGDKGEVQEGEWVDGDDPKEEGIKHREEQGVEVAYERERAYEGAVEKNPIALLHSPISPRLMP